VISRRQQRGGKSRGWKAGSSWEIW